MQCGIGHLGEFVDCEFKEIDGRPFLEWVYTPLDLLTDEEREKINPGQDVQWNLAENRPSIFHTALPMDLDFRSVVFKQVDTAVGSMMTVRISKLKKLNLKYRSQRHNYVSTHIRTSVPLQRVNASQVIVESYSNNNSSNNMFNNNNSNNTSFISLSDNKSNNNSLSPLSNNNSNNSNNNSLISLSDNKSNNNSLRPLSTSNINNNMISSPQRNYVSLVNNDENSEGETKDAVESDSDSGSSSNYMKVQNNNSSNSNNTFNNNNNNNNGNNNNNNNNNKK
jgi:hypothetical protein